MEIKTVAVYSEADQDALHVKIADESFCIGPAAPNQSYLNIPTIISVAEVSGADAIHPGYGFLAENSKFAEICEANKITFIGPHPSAMDKMGDKATARKTVTKAPTGLSPTNRKPSGSPIRSVIRSLSKLRLGAGDGG
jgi:acetyl-CoA carboxylase biotin carboxylase subunit